MAAIDRTISPVPLWAKLERTDADTGLSWHSLVDHSADVAACMEALLRLPTIQSRLATLAARDNLPSIWLSRVSAHAFLHDFGKANRGFRARLRRGSPPIGHVVQAVALPLIDELRDRVRASLPIEEMEGWGSYDEAFLSIVAHHGRPVSLESIIAGCAARPLEPKCGSVYRAPRWARAHSGNRRRLPEDVCALRQRSKQREIRVRGRTARAWP